MGNEKEEKQCYHLLTENGDKNNIFLLIFFFKCVVFENCCLIPSFPSISFSSFDPSDYYVCLSGTVLADRYDY